MGVVSKELLKDKRANYKLSKIVKESQKLIPAVEEVMKLPPEIMDNTEKNQFIDGLVKGIDKAKADIIEEMSIDADVISKSGNYESLSILPSKFTAMSGYYSAMNTIISPYNGVPIGTGAGTSISGSYSSLSASTQTEASLVNTDKSTAHSEYSATEGQLNSIKGQLNSKKR